MDRRAFVAGTLALLAAPLAAEAQSANTVRRLGYVSFTDLPKLDASFNSALRRLGWEEGRNLVVERRNTQSGATLAEVAAEIVRLAPDVIVVPNAGIAVMMRWETTTIPIVVMVGGDLVAPGLVESLARPGRNVTGTQVVQLDLMGKRLQLLKEILVSVRPGRRHGQRRNSHSILRRPPRTRTASRRGPSMTSGARRPETSFGRASIGKRRSSSQGIGRIRFSTATISSDRRTLRTR
jgi:hypothetical protein